jgi:hypothetical protein
MSIYLILIIVIGHFVGDWLCQSREIAESKHDKFSSALLHSALTNAILWVFLITLPSFVEVNEHFLLKSIAFFLTFLVLHLIQDGILWMFYYDLRRIRFAEKVEHDKIFFNTIAVDQIIHLSLLFITANLMNF